MRWAASSVLVLLMIGLAVFVLRGHDENDLRSWSSTISARRHAQNCSSVQKEVTIDLCGPKSSYEEYYDVDYFKWQIRHQLFQATHADLTRYGRIKPEHAVVEIGCSAGAVLNTIACAKKFCVEINAHAREYAAKTYNLTTFRCVAELPNNSIDYAYSISVLEHVEAPVTILRQLLPKMRSGSMLEIQVKNEGRQSASNYSDLQRWSHKKRDLNNHMYTWTELLLGNMIEASGFKITQIVSSIAAYPPNYEKIRLQVTAEQWEKIVADEGRRQGIEVLTAFAKKP